MQCLCSIFSIYRNLFIIVLIITAWQQIVRVVLKTDSSVDMEQQKEKILEEVIIFENYKRNGAFQAELLKNYLFCYI